MAPHCRNESGIVVILLSFNRTSLSATLGDRSGTTLSWLCAADNFVSPVSFGSDGSALNAL